MNRSLILHIAVPAPLYGEFDYLAPKGIDASNLKPGVRVKVPFGRNTRCGVLLRVSSESPIAKEKLKPAKEILDEHPLLSSEDRRLLIWAANYYQHPVGEVFSHALPVRLRKGEAESEPKLTGLKITLKGSEALADPPRAPRQVEILKTLAESPDGIPRKTLIEQCGDCSAILRQLKDKEWITPCQLNHSVNTPDTKHTLYPEQADAFEALKKHLGQYSTFLLEGVTGSGKTEVYLSLTQEVIDSGKQVLILVPEISLTPQLMRRVQNRIKGELALLHSALNDREREIAWSKARKGKAQVILGTRSAIFTPLPRLGLIIVDEEHDLSFKQQDGFRYSARDLAVVRASRSKCPLVLGSATPSLETLHNANQGRYQHLKLAARAGGAKPPKVSLIDIRSAPLRDGLSPVLIKQIKATMDAGNQAMLFLNRRGYAPVVICHDCGWLSDCPRCDARMTLHLSKNLLWCHHCGHQRRNYTSCPDCKGTELRSIGQGTEQLEKTLSEIFPDVPIARIDRDSTRRKGSLEDLLTAIREGHYRILLGTQMLAKGHHFPDVTLVGMIDMDQGLFGADFRAAERMAQLIVQVSGRAGRAKKPGHVLLQTRQPEHPLLQTLIQQGYPAFARQALEERKMAALPPFSHQALLRAEATTADKPQAFLDQAMEMMGEHATQDVEFWGPIPAPMERKGGKIRAHLLIQSPNRARLQKLLSQTVTRLSTLKSARQVRWSIDVDPQESV